MKSVPGTLFFKAMKEEPTVFPFGPIAELIAIPKRPYLPGEKCYVREAWRPECPTKGTYKGFLGTGYKDGTFRLTGWPNGFEAYPNGKWRSPVTMPMWAARRFVTVLSCTPIRVEEVTEQDAVKMGLFGSPITRDCKLPKFKRWWNEKHPGKEWCWKILSEEITSK